MHHSAGTVEDLLMQSNTRLSPWAMWPTASVAVPGLTPSSTTVSLRSSSLGDGAQGLNKVLELLSAFTLLLRLLKPDRVQICECLSGSARFRLAARVLGYTHKLVTIEIIPR